MAWRRHYGITDESSDTEHEVPTITFTDDITSSRDLEIGVEDCQAHIPPLTRLPKRMTESGANEMLD